MQALRLTFFIAVAMAATVGSKPAAAQVQDSCPANLQALSTQVQTASLQVGLAVSFDELIANAGGLSQAISNTRALLDEVSIRRERMPEDATSEAVQPLDEAILMLSTTVGALECRQAQGS